MIWAPIMYRDEDAMFTCRLEAFAEAPAEVRHVVVEATCTHRGIPKSLNFPIAGLAGDPEIRYIVDDTEPGPDPWVNEHRQRNAAWDVIGAEADDDDAVLISDVDEIPSPSLLAWAAGPGQITAAAVRMRTFLFAVDWEVACPVPPPCVITSVGYLRDAARLGWGLAEVRDRRDRFAVFPDGGWHFSWVGQGGPEWQRVKLETATCHVEILSTPEAGLIRSGARWRTAENGGGLPVVPVEVDETWPAYVHERRCPRSWFRPQVPSATASSA